MTNIRDTHLLTAFGNELRKKRQSQGLSQESLAITADIPISQIGRIERGEINPSLSTLNAVALALNITLAELVSF